MKLSEALRELAMYGSQRETALDLLLDSDGTETVRLELSHLQQMLRRCIKQELSISDLEDWAMLMEARDEFDAEQIEDYLYALNNPGLMAGADVSADPAKSGLSQQAVERMYSLVKAQLFS